MPVFYGNVVHQLIVRICLALLSCSEKRRNELASLCLGRKLDCDLELVSTGIRQLKRLSHAFNDIIVQEER